VKRPDSTQAPEAPAAAGMPREADRLADLLDQARSEAEGYRVLVSRKDAELQVVLDAVPAAVFITRDVEAKHIEGNRLARTLLRTGPRDNISKSADRPPEHYRVFQDGRELSPDELPMQVAARTGTEVQGAELDMVFGDGTSTTLVGNAWPLLDESGRPSGAVGAFVDVTRQREAERALRLREQQLETLADTVPDILARFDRQLRHVFVNAAAERATGLPRASFLGKTHRELGMSDEVCRQWESALGRALASEEPITIEFGFASPGGKRWYESRLIPEPGPQGRIDHVLAVSRDVTETRAAATALAQAIRAAEEAREEAEAASRAKDQFLAMLGHELRNPLAPITLTVELMKRRAPGILERERDVIERQARHLQALVDDLLDVSRIARGKLQLRREAVELAPLVEAALESVHPLLEQRGHRVLNDVARGLWVSGDPVRVRQIFANLLTNAAKYTPEGGEIRLSSSTAGARVSVSVADDGIGLSPDVVPSLFDPFFQAPQGKERAVGGLGVGLALVRSLARLHGGEARVESPGPGRGSTFTVELPLLPREGPAVRAPAPHRSTVPPVRRLSVLVVDDNADAAESLADAVRLLGHRVTAVHDGAAALEQATVRDFDLALIDIGLPVMDGFEVARRLRALGRPLALVAVTGYGTQADVQQALAAGFDAHHTKPMDLDVLAQLLAACQQAALGRERRPRG